MFVSLHCTHFLSPPCPRVFLCPFLSQQLKTERFVLLVFKSRFIERKPGDTWNCLEKNSDDNKETQQTHPEDSRLVLQQSWPCLCGQIGGTYLHLITSNEWMSFYTSCQQILFLSLFTFWMISVIKVSLKSTIYWTEKQSDCSIASSLAAFPLTG